MVPNYAPGEKNRETDFETKMLFKKIIAESKVQRERERETILTSSMKACNLERRLVRMIIRSRHLVRILFNGLS